MDRRTEVLKHVTKQKRGIEVGPWFSPLAPKSQGYACLSLDVFDTETLRENARKDPNIPADRIPYIEEVDLIGTSTGIEGIVESLGELGSFDYVISSHNFEHLPNPIKFLQGCGKVLRKDGFLSMAIPDKRACFDYFRPHTTLGTWIEAYLGGHDRPTFADLFEQTSLHCRFKVGEEMRTGSSLSEDPGSAYALRTLKEAYETWVSRAKAGDTAYHDTHCSVFTPSSFRILLSDVAFLKLSPFEIEEVTAANNNEFYVHLRNVGYVDCTGADEQRFYADRQNTLHEIENEVSFHSVNSYRQRYALDQLSLHRSRIVGLCEQMTASGKELAALAQASEPRSAGHAKPRTLRQLAKGFVRRILK